MVDTDFDRNPCSYAFCGMTCITIFISCFLLGFSFDTMDPTSMGFLFNRNTMELKNDTVYGAEKNSGGRFFVGLGQAFSFQYPRTLLRVRTVLSWWREKGAKGERWIASPPSPCLSRVAPWRRFSPIFASNYALPPAESVLWESTCRFAHPFASSSSHFLEFHAAEAERGIRC